MLRQILLNVFRVLLAVTGLLLLGFNAQLYIICKQQKLALDTISDQQKIELTADSKKFDQQRQEITHVREDLQDAYQQIKDLKDDLAVQKQDLSDQKNALAQEITARQQVNDEVRKIKILLTDIRAEADAIKQDIKGWQKDDVSVLAELEQKINDCQDQIKSLQDSIIAVDAAGLNQKIVALQSAVEKLMNPPGPAIEQKLPDSTDKVEHVQYNL